MKRFWIGLAVGTLAGGVVTLLLASRTGNATRRKLRHGWEDLGDSLADAADYLKEQAERLGGEAQRLVENSRSGLQGALGTAQDYAKTASSKASEVGSRLM